jgi:hypothetical protein
MGLHANDLGRLGKMLTEMPNVYVDVGAVLYDVGRQPRGSHDFFVKFQDRIVLGKFAYQPEEYPYYWRVFETNDDYYRGYRAFWKLYGIGLAGDVLRKAYYKNALTITPALAANRVAARSKADREMAYTDSRCLIQPAIVTSTRPRDDRRIP